LTSLAGGVVEKAINVALDVLVSSPKLDVLDVL